MKANPFIAPTGTAGIFWNCFLNCQALRRFGRRLEPDRTACRILELESTLSHVTIRPQFLPFRTSTTAQSLGALLKSARDIMRKDKGLNGDLDRLPMLTWVIFLKFLDDLEIQREGVERCRKERKVSVNDNVFSFIFRTVQIPRVCCGDEAWAGTPLHSRCARCPRVSPALPFCALTVLLASVLGCSNRSSQLSETVLPNPAPQTSIVASAVAPRSSTASQAVAPSGSGASNVGSIRLLEMSIPKSDKFTYASMTSMIASNPQVQAALRAHRAFAEKREVDEADLRQIEALLQKVEGFTPSLSDGQVLHFTECTIVTVPGTQHAEHVIAYLIRVPLGEWFFLEARREVLPWP